MLNVENQWIGSFERDVDYRGWPAMGPEGSCQDLHADCGFPRLFKGLIRVKLAEKSDILTQYDNLIELQSGKIRVSSVLCDNHHNVQS
jgi:hypothetical protein